MNSSIEMLARARADLARRPVIGADGDDVASYAEAAWRAAVQGVMTSAVPPVDILIRSGTALHAASIAAFQRGATAAGEAYSDLARRTAVAISDFGRAAGDVLREMLGGRPYDFALLGVGVAVLFGAALFLTPGGQIVLSQLPELLPAWGPR